MPTTRSSTAGNGSIKTPHIARDEVKENIFVFIPNLIGTIQSCTKTTTLHTRLPMYNLLTRTRLLPYLPGHPLPLLYATPSPHMLHTLLHILPPRRPRRPRSPQIQPVHKVRCSARHGHRSLHHGLSAGIPGICLPPLVNCLPGTHQPGFGKPLHAHVRHLDHGRERTEP
jgi:hypothetical protein